MSVPGAHVVNKTAGVLIIAEFSFTAGEDKLIPFGRYLELQPTLLPLEADGVISMRLFGDTGTSGSSGSAGSSGSSGRSGSSGQST